VIVLFGLLIFLPLSLPNSVGVADEIVSSNSSVIDPHKYFTQEQIDRGHSYRSETYILFGAKCAAFLLILVLFTFTGTSQKLEARLARISGNSHTISIILYFLSLYLILSAVLFPFSFYSSYVREKNYGFATLTLSRWFSDYAKSFAITFVLGAVLIVGFFFIIRKFPRTWHIIGCAGFTLYIALIIFAAPVIIDPLFHKFTPLSDSNLRGELISLAKKAGIDAREVFVTDASARTTHTNAYFTGLSSTKRIVLYDTLLASNSPSEVKIILAHEIGHWKHLHVLKGILIACVGAFVALALLRFFLLLAKRSYEEGGKLRFLRVSEIHAPSTLPLILLVLFILGVFWLPVENAISRHFERQADRESLLLTGDPDSFIAAEVKLAVDNASDLNPPRAAYYFLHTHPTALERIATAEDFAARQKKE
jgi:STE24 endopeptidase